jgi:hypothetical protein
MKIISVSFPIRRKVKSIRNKVVIGYFVIHTTTEDIHGPTITSKFVIQDLYTVRSVRKNPNGVVPKDIP